MICDPDFKQGSHRLDGVFLATGAGLQINTGAKATQIIDLVLSLLQLLDTPVLDNMDGRVLTEVIGCDRPVKIIAYDTADVN